jgi:peroxiredoxin
MHRFIQEHHLVTGAGLTTIVFYHSPADKLAAAQKDAAPFDLVADPAKMIFAAFGVENGLRGLVSPSVMIDYAKAVAAGYPPGLFSSDGGITGNPADFIVDASGRIALAHYGTQYADSLDAPDAARAWKTLQESAARRAPNLLATA